MSHPDPSEESPKQPVTFVTTQWTRVREARGDSPEAKAALSDLCAAYYAPVFAFIRHHAPNEDAARDLTQEFFAHLLARQGITTVDPQRGRFREVLKGEISQTVSDHRQVDEELHDLLQLLG